MAKYIKTRKGNDGFYYPYTSPDLVIDENGKSATTKFNEINTQLENIGQSTQEQINTSIDKAIEEGKMHSDASKLSIIDENNNFMSDNVEGALEELNTQCKDIANILIKNDVIETNASYLTTKKPTICFIFDDTSEFTYAIAEKFKVRNINFTTALRTDFIPNRITWEQVKELQAQGNEIAYHGTTHNIGIENLKNDITSFLLSAKNNNINIFGYVGANGLYSEPIVFHEYFNVFKWARGYGATNGVANVVDPVKYFKQIKGSFIDDLDSADAVNILKNKIDRISAYGEGVTFICSHLSNEINSNFDEILDYIITKDIAVKTVSEAYKDYSSIFESWSDNTVFTNSYNEDFIRNLQTKHLIIQSDGKTYSDNGEIVDIPISRNANGRKGDIAINDNFIYVCYDKNKWTRFSKENWVDVVGNIVLDSMILDVEKGNSNTFNVKLSQKPSSDQTITINSDNANVTISPSSLTFTSENYSTNQTITVSVSNSVNIGKTKIILSNPDVTSKELIINILGAGSTPVPPVSNQYTITNNLTNCINSNSATSVDENGSYTATITANSGYSLGAISVTMGGVDITNTVVNNSQINITNVTGNIVISCNSTQIEQVNLFKEENLAYDSKVEHNGITGYKRTSGSTGSLYIDESLESNTQYTISLKWMTTDDTIPTNIRLFGLKTTDGINTCGSTLITDGLSTNGEIELTTTVNMDCVGFKFLASTNDIMMYDIEIIKAS